MRHTHTPELACWPAEHLLLCVHYLIPPPSEWASACAYQGLIDVSHLAHVSDYTPYKSVPHISLLLDFPISHQPCAYKQQRRAKGLFISWDVFVDQQLASNKHLVVCEISRYPARDWLIVRAQANKPDYFRLLLVLRQSFFRKNKSK